MDQNGSKPTLKTHSQTIPMYPREWANLEDLAEQAGARAATGQRFNEPSWRSLLRAMARGKLGVVNPETGETFVIQPGEVVDWSAPILEE